MKEEKKDGTEAQTDPGGNKKNGLLPGKGRSTGAGRV